MSSAVNMPSAPSTVPALVRAAAAKHGALPAIVDGDTTLSYAELGAQAELAARALVALNIQAGERVAIWAPNVWHWVVAACGVHAAGAVLVPINTRMKGAEAADILQRSGAKLLFVVGDFLGNYLPAQLDGLLPAHVKHVVVIGSGARPSEMTWQHFMGQAQGATPVQVQAREANINANTTADLMFTSGTTGRPKGVMAAHGPMLRAFAEWARVVGLAPGARYLVINPFFHSFGYKAGWVAALQQGATIYPCAVFDADVVLATIARHRINFLPGPPTLFLTMLAHPRLQDFDISSLNAAVTGAANVPPVLIERMRQELGIAHVTTAYGLTECGGCATVCDPGDDVQTVASTCGKALPGTEVRVADAAGNTLPAGQAGEVLLRGYHVMQGYFEDEAATRQAIDEAGWLHTGDVGVMDERGYLRITDRLKDMFITGGFNVYPAEVERLLSPHPAIAQVAVIGVTEERQGEVGCAFVVLRSEQCLLEAELIAWARANMANYKVPRSVWFVPALPTNASGKVDKKILRSMAQPATLHALMQPLQLGDLHLANRIVMAPMTRNRAAADGTPTEVMTDYYAQRASAGLIVAEGTWPSRTGQAYCRQPGIETPAHIAAWRRVTDAVHAKGGCIVLQVMHAGRIGSAHIKAPGVRTVAPSALRAAGEIWTDAAGMQPHDEPQVLTTFEVRQIVQEHAQAARNARAAGFDGVELHGTSGYLPMQFLSSSTNLRDDEYGGSAANRARFAVECLQAMAEAIGAGRVGLRVNPGNTYNDTADDDSGATHAELMRQAAALNLAYLHVMRSPVANINAFALARQHFGERLIVNDGYDAGKAEYDVAVGVGLAVSFARHFIANPDLVGRFVEGKALAKFDRKTLYTAGAVGYSDYWGG